MIPVNVNEPIIYNDEISGVSYRIKPMVGDTEYFTHELLKKYRENNEDTFQVIDSIFDMFIVGWSAPADLKLPEFPSDKKPSKMFSHKDKSEMVFNVIIKGTNRLDVEEKKS